MLEIAANYVTVLYIGPDNLSTGLAGAAAPLYYAIRWRVIKRPYLIPWSSDQWSFLKEGYPALMVTDTAPLRYPFYHKPQDTPDKVRYDFLYSVVTGLKGVISDLALLK